MKNLDSILFSGRRDSGKRVNTQQIRKGQCVKMQFEWDGYISHEYIDTFSSRNTISGKKIMKINQILVHKGCWTFFQIKRWVFSCFLFILKNKIDSFIKRSVLFLREERKNTFSYEICCLFSANDEKRIDENSFANSIYSISRFFFFRFVYFFFNKKMNDACRESWNKSNFYVLHIENLILRGIHIPLKFVLSNRFSISLFFGMLHFISYTSPHFPTVQCIWCLSIFSYA